jgi:transposase InsO family protein
MGHRPGPPAHQPWISRLVARYRTQGEAAFEPRSRRPRSSPTATDPAVVDLVVRLRTDLTHDGLHAGPHTLAWHLEHDHGIRLSPATVWRICTRAGLVTPDAAKRPKSSHRRFQAELPNQLWQSDFTHWTLASGRDVEILNWLDDHSRYLLASTCHRPVTGPVCRQGRTGAGSSAHRRARVSSGRSRYCRSASSSHSSRHGDEGTSIYSVVQPPFPSRARSPVKSPARVRRSSVCSWSLRGFSEDAGSGVPARDDLVHAGQVKVSAGAGERVAQLGFELRGL